MYSVVLMMALTSGGDAQASHFRGGCSGGYGCSGAYSGCYGGYGGCTGGYAYGGCTGGGYYGGCMGSSAYSGCCGGGGGHQFLGGHGGGLFKHHRGGSCSGGYGGCTGGYAYGGCTGYGGGCTGYGYGGCTGGGYYGGCAGGTGGVIVIPETDKKVDKPKDGDKKDGDKKDKDESFSAAPATIIVSLPADATLKIDDAVTSSTSSRRIFTSPALPMGREFHYTLKAEYSRDGKPVAVAKEIVVRGGEETRVSMEAEGAGIASK
jgi:uncharacterized protein (TIGR03000 family)